MSCVIGVYFNCSLLETKQAVFKMRLISLSVLLHLFIFCAIMGVTVTSPAAVCQDGNGNTYTFGKRLQDIYESC